MVSIFVNNIDTTISRTSVNYDILKITRCLRNYTFYSFAKAVAVVIVYRNNR